MLCVLTCDLWPMACELWPMACDLPDKPKLPRKLLNKRSSILASDVFQSAGLLGLIGSFRYRFRDSLSRVRSSKRNLPLHFLSSSSIMTYSSLLLWFLSVLFIYLRIYSLLIVFSWIKRYIRCVDTDRSLWSAWKLRTSLNQEFLPEAACLNMSRLRWGKRQR